MSAEEVDAFDRACSKGSNGAFLSERRHGTECHPQISGILEQPG